MGSLIYLYKQMMAHGDNFRGLSLVKHKRVLRKLIQRTGATTLLDYGSGKGDAYDAPHLLHEAWGVPRPYLYDPAFPELSVRPDSLFDGIICSDVLEHIPEDELADAITYMIQHSVLFVWASICCRPAKKCFADSVTNLHVTVRPFAWWSDLFERHREACEYRGDILLLETP